MRQIAHRRPGPPKQFDPQRTLEPARDLFWRRGFDGTGLAELEGELGVGRNSLHDTFGNKRALYLASLELYGDSVIAAICDGLERPGATAFANLERVLGKLASHHGSGESFGCLLGVGLAQAQREDAEVVAALRRGLGSPSRRVRAGGRAPRPHRRFARGSSERGERGPRRIAPLSSIRRTPDPHREP